MSDVTDVSDVARRIPADARIITIAGPVAVGKSTFAQALADALVVAGRGPVEVVSTDGFLYPNNVLVARGMFERKGFPESYDTTALTGFIRAVRNNEPAITVPEYSHDSFDITPGRTIAAPSIAIVEGVNALQSDFATEADVRIYLDADDDVVIGWYVARFVEFTRNARRSGAGFYTRFGALDDAGVAVIARQVWDAINAPNLNQHIRPTRQAATLVLRKARDHSLLPAAGESLS